MRARRLTLLCFTIIVLNVNLVACSSVQPMIQGTSTFTPTNTQTPSLTYTPTSTITSTPTNTPTPTSTPDIVATQQYDTFIISLNEYFNRGYITTMDGEFVSLENYEIHSRNEAGAYDWQTYDHDSKPINYLLQASVDIFTESKEGGCGFIFNYFDYGPGSMSNKHELVFLGNDSRAKYVISRLLSKVADSNFIQGALSSGSADISLTLIIDKEEAKFIVKDELALSWKNTPFMDAGFGVVALSGLDSKRTNCTFRNVVLWIFPD